MEAGDWTGLAGAVIGLLGVGVAVWVARRQRVDTVLWESEKDVYLSFMANLDKVEAAFVEVKSRPFTQRQAEASGIEPAFKELDRVANRTSNELLKALMARISSQVRAVTFDAIPEARGSLANWARRSEKLDDMQRLIDQVSRNAAAQTRAAAIALDDLVPRIRAAAKTELGPRRKRR